MHQGEYLLKLVSADSCLFLLLLDDTVATEAGRSGVREKSSVDEPDGRVIPYLQVQKCDAGTSSGTRTSRGQDVVPLRRVGVHLPQHQPEDFTYCSFTDKLDFYSCIWDFEIQTRFYINSYSDN